MKSPCTAGEAEFTNVEFSACTTAGRPKDPAEKIAGEAASILIDCDAIPALPRRTSTFTVPVAVSKGTCALICVGETKNSGAAMPLNATVVSSSVGGSGAAEAAATSP